MESVVLGGAILGCGGGGKLEDGLYLGESATAQGSAHLVEPNTLSMPGQLAIVGLVHSSSKDTHQVSPRQAHHSIELLQSALDEPIIGLINAGAGAVDSILGWELSSYLSVPLLDMGLPATYHPLPLRNLLLFWAETAASETFTIALAGHVGQTATPRQHLWQGNPAQLQRKLDEFPADKPESYVFAAGALLSPKLITSCRLHTINNTIQIGKTIVATNDDGGEATFAAAQDLLPCKAATFATVTQISWQAQDAHDVIELRDAHNRQLLLTYSQRYLELSEDGKQAAAFPDLIITLGTLGTPLAGEEVFIGQDIYLIIATSFS
jgi:DUF917 family protein